MGLYALGLLINLPRLRSHLPPITTPSPGSRASGESLISPNIKPLSNIQLSSPPYAVLPASFNRHTGPMAAQGHPEASRPKTEVQPCRYKTGKTLGAGSYSVVKECVHIDTGRYYAAKVINKRLMTGREHMVRIRSRPTIPFFGSISGS